MGNIKVILVDDHTIVRQGLRSVLNENKNIEVIGEAENGFDALKKAIKLKPNVIIMDISMPRLNGLETTVKIKKKLPDTYVIMLSMHTNKEMIFHSFKAGASGYLVKKSATSELVTAIIAVSKGESYLDSSISKIVIEDYIKYAGKKTNDSYYDLTNREREIFQLIAEGKTNRQISDILFISIKTVETHHSNIMKKLNCSNIVDLTKYAIKKGFIDLNN